VPDGAPSLIGFTFLPSPRQSCATSWNASGLAVTLMARTSEVLEDCDAARHEEEVISEAAEVRPGNWPSMVRTVRSAITRCRLWPSGMSRRTSASTASDHALFTKIAWLQISRATRSPT
jgi:hypothetical protein